jgi:carbon storage regulator
MEVLSNSLGGNSMLILTRKPNESVIIDNQVILKILGVRGNQVHIGVEAPSHININREEVQQRLLPQKGHLK